MISFERFFLHCTALFVCGLCSSVLRAQEPYFRHVELERSASGIHINSITEDSQNVLWLASNDGLWKWSGTSCNKWELPASLLGENVTIIRASGDSLVGGTRSGLLFSVRGDQARIWNILPLKLTTQVSDITVLPGAGIMVSTLGEGIVFSERGKLTHITSTDGLADDYVYSLATDSVGRIFAGSDRGLSVIEVGSLTGHIRFKNYTTNQGLPENIIRKVVYLRKDLLAVGTEESGFCFFKPSAGTCTIPDRLHPAAFGPVTELVEEGDAYWIGSQKTGLYLYEGIPELSGRAMTSSPFRSGTSISSLYKDHEGNLWVSDGSALYLTRGSRISFIRNYEGYGEGGIHALLADSRGRVWFVNDKGIFRIETRGGQVYVSKPLAGTPYEHLMVISMYEDRYGFIWMGTFDKGVLRFDPWTFATRMITANDGLINPSVLSLCGRDDEIWFATLGGICRCILADSTIDGFSRVEGFEGTGGPGNTYIFKVVVDPQGKAWFATDGNGLGCYDHGRFITYGEKQGLKSKVIYSLALDPKGNLWMSTVSDGIYRFDGNSFRHFSLEQGLSDLNITSIGADPNGNIAIVSTKGVDVIDCETFQVTSFGLESGIGNMEPDLNVVDIDPDGSFWIGSSIGIIRMKLDRGIARRKPRLILNKVLTFLEPNDTAAGSVFPYDRNHISFDYAGIWYANPEKLTYQYKLEGYSDEWITTRDRFVTFPNLLPGDYQFMVRTSLNGNYFDAPRAGYRFTITTPVWQRPWFILLATLVFGTLVYIFIRYRYNRLKMLEQLKKENIETQYEVLKNQVNPHFLFNSFNTLITVIEDDPHVAVGYVNRLSDFFRSILTYREKDLIALREEMKLVADYIFLQQKRYGSNFKVTTDIPDNLKDRAMVPPMAVQILIENCFKHNAVSRETPLSVELFTEGTQYLVIRNNTNARMVKERSTGVGLQNLRSRYLLLGKPDVMIERDETSFTVRLPLIMMGT